MTCSLSFNDDLNILWLDIHVICIMLTYNTVLCSRAYLGTLIVEQARQVSADLGEAGEQGQAGRLALHHCLEVVLQGVLRSFVEN